MTRSKPTGPCDVCRSTKYRCRRGDKDSEVTASLATAAGTEEWEKQWQVTVRLKNGEAIAACDLVESAHGPLTTIAKTDEVKQITRIHESNFWPLDELKAIGVLPADNSLFKQLALFVNRN